MASNNIHGGRSMSRIVPTTLCGAPLMVRSCEKTPAAATMISTWAVRYMELTDTSQMPFQPMSP